MFAREHFLADLMNKRGFTRMAELGVWKGRTFLHCLVHCPKATIIAVDEWQKRPERAGVEGGQTYQDWDMAGLERHVRECSKPFGDRAIILKMSTAGAAQQIPDGSLDLIFIDADHSEEGVRADIRNWRNKVRSGGVIAGHDIDWPTVKRVVEEAFGTEYKIAIDNVWWIEC